MNIEEGVEQKKSFSQRIISPFDRVQHLIKSEYDLERLRTVNSVDPVLVCKTLSWIRQSFHFVYLESNRTLNNEEVIREAFEKVDEVGEVLGVDDDGYDRRAHELLGLLMGRSKISESLVRNVSGKQLLMVLGALGVVFRSPGHELRRQRMLSYFREVRVDFKPDYYFAISVLLGLRNDEGGIYKTEKVVASEQG